MHIIESPFQLAMILANPTITHQFSYLQEQFSKPQIITNARLKRPSLQDYSKEPFSAQTAKKNPLH